MVTLSIRPCLHLLGIFLRPQTCLQIEIANLFLLHKKGKEKTLSYLMTCNAIFCSTAGEAAAAAIECNKTCKTPAIQQKIGELNQRLYSMFYSRFLVFNSFRYCSKNNMLEFGLPAIPSATIHPSWLIFLQ